MLIAIVLFQWHMSGTGSMVAVAGRHLAAWFTASILLQHYSHATVCGVNGETMLFSDEQQSETLASLVCRDGCVSLAGASMQGMHILSKDGIVHANMLRTMWPKTGARTNSASVNAVGMDHHGWLARNKLIMPDTGMVNTIVTRIRAWISCFCVQGTHPHESKIMADIGAAKQKKTV
jgi:hypothetical protein